MHVSPSLSSSAGCTYSSYSQPRLQAPPERFYAALGRELGRPKASAGLHAPTPSLRTPPRASSAPTDLRAGVRARQEVSMGTETRAARVGQAARVRIGGSIPLESRAANARVGKSRGEALSASPRSAEREQSATRQQWVSESSSGRHANGRGCLGCHLPEATPLAHQASTPAIRRRRNGPCEVSGRGNCRRGGRARGRSHAPMQCPRALIPRRAGCRCPRPLSNHKPSKVPPLPRHRSAKEAQLAKDREAFTPPQTYFLRKTLLLPPSPPPAEEAPGRQVLDVPGIPQNKVLE